MKQKKIYDRQTKRWVHPDNVASLKTRKTCIGGKPHDYVLVLPWHSYFEGEPNVENIEKYYELEKERRQFCVEIDKKIKKLGIVSKYGRLYGSESKHYICSVCGKKKWE